MPGTASNQASVTVIQDGIKSYWSALVNAQHYDIFVDHKIVGLLNGYTSRTTCALPPGTHSICLRAYARSSATPTRVYECSETLALDLSPGEHKTLFCGLMPGPPFRRWSILGGGTLIAIVLVLGLGPIRVVEEQTRYAIAAGVAVLVLASSWYGYSVKPGSTIYLRETSSAPEAAVGHRASR